MLRFWCCLSSNTRRSRRNAKNRQRNADADTEEEDAEKEEAEDSEDEPEEEEDEEDEEDGDNDQDEDDEDDEDEESAEDVVTPGQRQIRSQEGASEAITTRAKASGNSEDLEEEEDVVAGTYNGVDYSPATAEQQWACCTIQRVVRGYLGRLFVQQLWHEAFALVNKFWLRKLRRWQDEKMRKQAIIEARQQFVRQYVSDVLQTSATFLLQMEASTIIQRTWRGHRARMVVPSKPPKKILRRRKVHINPRIKMEQLRRVWAARNFEPKEGWPGGKYVWTLEYDMFEHVDNPPKGESHGFRNYKVNSLPRSEREKKLLISDSHAWVGIPVLFETTADAEQKALVSQSDNVQHLIITSPYGKKQFHTGDKGSEKQALTARAALSPIAEEPQADSPLSRRKSERNILKYMSHFGYDIREELQGDQVDEDQRVQDEELDAFLASMGEAAARYYQQSNTKKPRPNRSNFSEYDPKTGRKLVAVGQFDHLLHKDEKEQKRDELLASAAARQRNRRRQLANIISERSMRLSTSLKRLPNSVTPLLVEGSNALNGENMRRSSLDFSVGSPTNRSQADAFDLIRSVDSSAQKIDQRFNPRKLSQHVVNTHEFLLQQLNLVGRSKLIPTKSGAVEIENVFLDDENSDFLKIRKDIFMNAFSHHTLLTSNLSDTALSNGGSGNVSDFVTTQNSGSMEVDELLQEFSSVETPIRGARKPKPSKYISDTATSDHYFIYGASGSVVHYNNSSLLSDLTNTINQRQVLDKNDKALTGREGINHGHIPSIHKGIQRPDFIKQNIDRVSNSPLNTANKVNSKTNVFGFGGAGLYDSSRSIAPDTKSFLTSNARRRDELDQWKASFWGHLKKGVETLVSDPHLQEDIIDAIVGNDTTISDFENTLWDYEDDAERLGSNRFYGQFATEADNIPDDDDEGSDEGLLRRSVRPQKKQIQSKVKVWAHKPPTIYKLRYSWLPQPLVHNAANNLYYERTVKDYYHNSTFRQPESHFMHQLKREKEKQYRKVLKKKMSKVVSTASIPSQTFEHSCETTSNTVTDQLVASLPTVTSRERLSISGNVVTSLNQNSLEEQSSRDSLSKPYSIQLLGSNSSVANGSISYDLATVQHPERQQEKFIRAKKEPRLRIDREREKRDMFNVLYTSVITIPQNDELTQVSALTQHSGDITNLPVVSSFQRVPSRKSIAADEFVHDQAITGNIQQDAPSPNTVLSPTGSTQSKRKYNVNITDENLLRRQKRIPAPTGPPPTSMSPKSTHNLSTSAAFGVKALSTPTTARSAANTAVSTRTEDCEPLDSDSGSEDGSPRAVRFLDNHFVGSFKKELSFNQDTIPCNKVKPQQSNSFNAKAFKLGSKGVKKPKDSTIHPYHWL